MKKLFIITSLVLLLACGDSRTRKYICNCDEIKRVETFVSKNIKPANNLSDEEMEDVIRELYKTGVRLNCKTELVFSDYQPNDTCKRIMYGIDIYN